MGFPGETRDECEETASLIKHCQYDSLYIFKYSARPGTPASHFADNVSEEEKAVRFLMLENVQKGIQKNIFNDYIGRQVRVLVEGVSRKSSLDMTGHSTCHKVVNFPGDSILAGREVVIQVTTAKPNSLYGTLANSPLN